MSFGDFKLKGRIVYLRRGILGYLPPAQYAAELFIESGYPVVCVEFGNNKEMPLLANRHVPRIRLAHEWSRGLPRILRAFTLTVSCFLELAIAVRKNGKPLFLVANGIHEQLICYLLKKFVGVPYVVQVHEAYNAVDLETLNRIFFRFEGAALRNALFLIFPEATRAKIYRDRHRLTCPSFIVFNSARKVVSVEAIDVRRKFHLPKDSFIVGYVGGIGPINVPERMIAALCEAPATHLILWGWGTPEYIDTLKTLAEKLGVTERTHFGGVLQRAKFATLAGVDASACIYVGDLLRLQHPATASNKLMESAAVGVPVITSAIPEFIDTVERHNIGLCLREVTPSHIAEAFRHLREDEVGRKRMSKNAMRLHRESWNYEHQFAPVLQHVRTLFPIEHAERATRGKKRTVRSKR